MKHHPHNAAAAMEITGLTEDEAYFILRFAGRVGYSRAIRRLEARPLRRLRRWFIQFGSWETPAIWQWDQGEPAWRFTREDLDTRGEPPFRYRRRFVGPGHVSLFGGRVTIYSVHTAMHGAVNIRTPWGYLCGKLPLKSFGRRWPWYLYLSPDATPNRARWAFGPRFKREEIRP